MLLRSCLCVEDQPADRPNDQPTNHDNNKTTHKNHHNTTTQNNNNNTQQHTTTQQQHTTTHNNTQQHRTAQQPTHNKHTATHSNTRWPWLKRRTIPPHGAREQPGPGGGFEMKYTAKFRTTVPPPEPELFDLFEEPGGERLDVLLESQGPQLGFPRRIVEQIVDIVPVVQLLHAPVPLPVDSVVEVLQILDKSLPEVEQVIEGAQDSSAHGLAAFLSPGAAVGGTVGGCANAVSCPRSCAADGAPAGGSAADRASACWFLRGCRWVRVAAALGAYGGLLVESGLLSHPVGPPTGVHRQPRAVYKILGTGNVSVIMPDKFPQSPINSGWCFLSSSTKW